MKKFNSNTTTTSCDETIALFEQSYDRQIFSEHFETPFLESDQNGTGIEELSGELIDAPETPFVDFNSYISDDVFHANADDIMKILDNPNPSLSEDPLFKNYYLTSGHNTFLCSPSPTNTIPNTVPHQLANPQSIVLDSQDFVTADSSPLVPQPQLPGRRPRKTSVLPVSSEQAEFHFSSPDIKPAMEQLAAKPKRGGGRKRSIPVSTPPPPATVGPVQVEVKLEPASIYLEEESTKRRKVKKYQLTNQDDPSVKNAIAAKKNRDRKRMEHERVVKENEELKEREAEKDKRIEILTLENSQLKRQLDDNRSQMESYHQVQAGAQFVANHLEATLTGFIATNPNVPNINVNIAPGISSNLEFQRQLHLQHPGQVVTTLMFSDPASGNMNYYIDTRENSNLQQLPAHSQ